MDITFRTAVNGDYDDISEVFGEMDDLHSRELPQIFRRPTRPLRSPRYIRDIIADPDSVIVVAEVDHNIVAAAHAIVRDAPEFAVFAQRRYAWIESFAVKEAYQRKGLGRELMEHVLRWAKEKGATRCELNVWEFNTRAREFYERLGYETASRRLWIDLDSGQDADV